ncbi:MAG: IPT/TIG domain-containing protein [Myxococcaceae bacterium]
MSAIAPDNGPLEGGTDVVITGTGFANVNVASSTSVTAVTPAGTEGAKDVVVTNPDMQSGTLANGFSYLVPTDGGGGGDGGAGGGAGGGGGGWAPGGGGGGSGVDAGNGKPTKSGCGCGGTDITGLGFALMALSSLLARRHRARK